MQTKIKLITENDIEQVYEISREQFDDECWSKQQFKDSLNSSSCFFYGVFCDNKLLSFILYQNLIDSLNLLLIATRNSSKNKGFASQLLNLLIAESNKAQIKAWLEVNRSNQPAVSLYAKYGFKVIYERKNYYPNNKSALIMELSNL